MVCIYYLIAGTIVVSLATKFSLSAKEGVTPIHFVLAVFFWPLVVFIGWADVVSNGFYWID